jgi:hypothetical protein
MNLQFENTKDSCSAPRAEIAEYLDGELAPNAELDLELHFAVCEICRRELNAQKKVSSTLEILLEENPEEFALPENFTKIVTAKAESNLDGLRNPKERSRALFICAILFLFLIFGFGTESETVLFAVEKFAEQILAVGGFVFHLFYMLLFGISTIFGSLFNKFVFSSSLTLVLTGATFVISFFLLSRMVLRFNRS